MKDNKNEGMSKQILFFLWMGIVVFGISCKKLTAPTDPKTQLYTQTITDVRLNEPLSLTFGDDDVVDKVAWTVSPNNNYTISTIANNAALQFTNAGTYTVTATMGDVYATYHITVSNIVYSENPGTNFLLRASKLINVTAHETVDFTVFNTTASSISWSVMASMPYTINRDDVKKTASITFDGSGYAAVSASDGINTQRRTIYIGNAATGTGDVFNFILADKLFLTPSVEVIPNGKKLVISARTNRKYNCDGDKILSYNLNSDYTIDYSGVSIASQTCAARSYATCINSFKNMPAGIAHPFQINFANKSYNGTVKYELGKYTINWNNNSDVIFTKLEAE